MPVTLTRWALAFFLLGVGVDTFAQSGTIAFQRTPNPDAAGLWIGEVTLKQVTYPPTGVVEPTLSEAHFRILLHVDATGKVRLLKDAVVAAKQTEPTEQIIVTKASLLPSLPVLRSAGANGVSGQRFSTAAFDFTDNDSNPADAALDLEGGLGLNLECGGVLLLDKNHPTNPFRHKFHPDHANEGPKAYIITRTLKLQFSSGIQNTGASDQLVGAYQETITGLNRAPLTVQGLVALTRVSTASTLNQ